MIGLPYIRIAVDSIAPTPQAHVDRRDLERVAQRVDALEPLIWLLWEGQQTGSALMEHIDRDDAGVAGDAEGRLSGQQRTVEPGGGARDMCAVAATIDRARRIAVIGGIDCRSIR